jgi:hypothetical protein
LFNAVSIVIIAVVTYNSILNSITNSENSRCRLTFKERIKLVRLLMIGKTRLILEIDRSAISIVCV